MSIFDFFKKRREKDPKKLLQEVLDGFEIKSFPKTVMEVLKALRDPEVSLVKVARLIELDMGMHIRVLKTVNSAAFGLTTKVSNIEHAVMLLGKAKLECLILPLAVKEALPDLRSTCLDMERFWLTAATRASLARLIAQRLHPATQAEAYTAGMLQDIAIPVLMKLKEKEYCSALETWNGDKSTRLVTMEKERFGFDHQGIGGLMAEQWNFPEYLVKAIALHHQRQNGNGVEPAVTLVSTLRYSNDITEENGIEVMVGLAQKKYGIPRDEILDLVDRAYQDAEELASMLR